MAALLAATWASSARAAEPDPATRLAAELAKLRGEVETLSTAIEREKDDRRARMRGLADQESQAEIELRRARLRTVARARRRAEPRARVEAKAATQAGLRPAVDAAIERLRAVVEASLPFRLEERLAAVDALEKRLADGLVTPAQAWSRLWEIAEDELRLGRESALDRQVVRLPSGEERLVQVIRIGMVALFYRASDKDVGQAAREGARWVWRGFSGEAEIDLVSALFASFEKRVRTGFFEIPWLAGGAP
jgi:hypothetical protein